MSKLYLQFLIPILHEFAGINKLFQLEFGGNAFKMLDYLQSFFCTLVSRVLFPKRIRVSDAKLVEVNLSEPASYLPLSAADFSAVFNMAV